MPLFLTSIACNVLDKIVADLDVSPRDLSVAFVPTASNPSENKEGTEDDRSKLIKLGFRVNDVDIATARHEELRQTLQAADVILVGGGNTFYLLQEARRSGFDEELTELIRAGKPYIGSSAGSVLLAPTIEPIKMMDDPRQAPELQSHDGLGIIDFLPLVHFGNVEFVDEYRQALSDMYSAGPRFVLVRDDEYIVVRDGFWRIRS
ncbi:Type 1 glutamine amidotransferase-like domain-containing protein [Micromonospora saelicesensis]|uniref:Type 1 glutamine amidotransferase-like domain-containing protein n=1 Tax=Micromonospora saelicesensis TaxID=285676 RepID=UPI003CF17A1D